MQSYTQMKFAPLLTLASFLLCCMNRSPEYCATNCVHAFDYVSIHVVWHKKMVVAFFIVGSGASEGWVAWVVFQCHWKRPHFKLAFEGYDIVLPVGDFAYQVSRTWITAQNRCILSKEWLRLCPPERQLLDIKGRMKMYTQLLLLLLYLYFYMLVA